MSFKIVRSDITKMNTEAIVNTASKYVSYGNGCDSAIYKAAGEEALLNYRREHIGELNEGEVFITPGFDLQAKYIIHAVSPRFKGGDSGEEAKLRACYQKSLQLAKENNIRSIAFPLIATGSFGYPKEEGMRIAVDEINAFLLGNDMDITLVVFGDKATDLGAKLYPNLEAYIDQNYVDSAMEEEYQRPRRGFFNSLRSERRSEAAPTERSFGAAPVSREAAPKEAAPSFNMEKAAKAIPPQEYQTEDACEEPRVENRIEAPKAFQFEATDEFDRCDSINEFDEDYERKLRERLKHLTDTFSEYLMYLISEKGMTNAEVWKRAIVDKKIFSKIKNNVDYHPNKLTAMCLCVGAMLNLDETKDLLARAGYALSPCDKMDLIFRFFIENEIYDMIELDIQLEEFGLPCIIK